MAKFDNLPFPIGTTYFDGQTPDTTTTTATNLEGKEYTVEDLYYLGSSTSLTGFAATKVLRTAYLKHVRVMRNVATVVLLPGYLAAPQESGTDGKFFLGRVNGYSNVGGQTPVQTIPAYGIDEFLPTLGVPLNDLFYATTDGPFLGQVSVTAAELLGDSSGTTAPIQIGDVLCSSTAAASTGSTTQVATMTSGKICNLMLAALTGKTLGFQILNRIGRALSAVTTSQTTSPLLMYFTKA